MSEPGSRFGARFWIRVGVVVALVAAVQFSRNVLELEWNLESIRETVERMGVWGPVVFVAMVSFRHFLLLPHMVILVAGGLVFGAVGGALYGAIGIFNAAMGVFFLTRWFGADSLRKRLSLRLQRVLDRASSRGGVGTLAFLNAYPFLTITVFHAAAGLTTMSAVAFAIAIALTSPIRTWTYAYFGSAIMEGSWQHIAGATAIAVLLLAPLLVPRVRERIREEFALEL
jgi:uncharacterized membrane protein YdjX (TVP38/TMEM64 family)